MFPLPALLRCHCNRNSIDSELKKGRREIIHEVLVAAFYPRPFRNVHGTCALEAASPLPALFVEAAERVVSTILFEPCLRIWQGRLSRYRYATGPDRFRSQHIRPGNV
jgi:hypothetical protein